MVTCSGATVNQGPGTNTGYGDSTQNGLTLNVQSGASVIGTSIGIDVNNNNTINNLGVITTMGIGGIGDVYGINGNGALTVNNSGTIGRADIPDSIFDLAGINEAGNGLLSVTNNAGGVIQGTNGILGFGVGTVVNSGLINAIGGGGDGINFAGNNTSSVSVTNYASGTITGDESAINATFANVVNYGTISAPTVNGVGILTDTMTLTNYASGIITGDGGAISGSLFAGLPTSTLTITNYGTISSTGSGSTAISGSVVNVTNYASGIVTGPVGAISGSVVNVTNSGSISTAVGGGGDAILMTSGAITNNFGGTITGDNDGIAAFNTSGSVSIFNAGTITGRTNDGVEALVGSVTVTNFATGTISGPYTAISADAGAVTVTNYGTITSFNSSVAVPQTAIFADTTATVTNTGTISAFGNGKGVAIESGGTAIVTNSGTISADNTAVLGSGAPVQVNNSGTITGSVSAIANPGGIATVSNSGTISSTGAGSIAITADTVNVTSNTGLISGAGTAISAANAANVNNSGTILGGSVGGIQANNVLTLTNSGTVQASASGSAVNTIGLLTVTNFGTISGGEGIVAGGFGLSSTLTNSGTIIGTGGIAAAFFGTGDTINLLASSHVVGAVQLGTGDTLTNAGSIMADTGVALSANGPSNTITNTGTIDGQIDLATTGNMLTNSGLLIITNPSAAVGVEDLVTGTFTQTAAGVLALRVDAAGASDTLSVTGTANLGGTLRVVVQPGLYGTSTTYLGVVSATNPITTTFAQTQAFNAADTAPLAFFTATATYDAVNVTLTRTGFGAAPGETLNERAVGNALDSVYSTALTGKAASFFSTLEQATSLGALNQLSGEAATDAERGAFQMMTQFLLLMLDPLVDGRSGSGGAQAIGFAPDEQASLPPDIALAYAEVLKAPPPTFAQRWTAWGASFGGSSTTNGDPVVGSNNVSARDFGFAAGMDYHFTPDTIAGFALAGGGTDWGVAQGLGGGRGDAFQAGIYGTTRAGPAYLAASLAFANHWMTTDRFALAGDQLTASFNAQSFGGRIETGYRYAVLPAIGVTPYAALQAQSFHTPSYSETDLTGGGFGLSYNAMTATDTRSELGARFDDPTLLAGMPLVLRGRIAWAHDWVSNPALDAVFQTLPGASFVVNGAPVPQNSALVSAGAELYLTPKFTLLARFDGEFAGGSQTYAGTGALRYRW